MAAFDAYLDERLINTIMPTVHIDGHKPYRLCFQLSSGRRFGLTDERAHDRMISSTEQQRSLIRPITVNELAEWIEFDPVYAAHLPFRFTGHHAGECMKFFAECEATERRELSQLLSHSDTLSFLERLHRTYHKFHQHPSEFLYQDVRWYFPLLKWLHADLAMQRQNLTATQWLSRLDRVPHLKKDEIKWSGVDAYLASLPGHERIATEQLISTTDYQAILPQLFRQVSQQGEVREIDFKWVNKPVTAKHRKQLFGFLGAAHVYLQHRLYGYEIVCLQPDDLFSDQTHWLVMNDRKLIASTLKSSLFNSISEAISAAKNHMDQAIRTRALLQNATSYQEYTLPERLNHYTNWVVTLPHYPAWLDGYSHFNLNNVLLHLRTSQEICGVTGYRCLVIHEVQSDLLQKRAHQSPQDTFPWASHWYETALNLALHLAVKSDCEAIALINGRLQQTIFNLDPDDLTLSEFYDRILMKVWKKLAKHWEAQIIIAQINVTIERSHLVHFKQGFLWLNEAGHPIQEFPSLSSAITCMNKEDQFDVTDLPMMPLTENMKRQIQQKGIPLMGCMRIEQ